MNLDKCYDEIIIELKKGISPRVFFDENLIEEIEQTITNDPTQESIQKILCILDHSARPLFKLSPQLLQLRSFLKTDEQIVFWLAACQKHIIEGGKLEGLKLPRELNDVLKTYLQHSNPEVVEWSLRTIDALGHKAITFKDNIVDVCPNKIMATLKGLGTIRSLCLHILKTRSTPTKR